MDVLSITVSNGEGENMDKFISIEIDRDTKYPVKVGHLCATSVTDAYEQMGGNIPREEDERLIILPKEVNQLIIDLNKIARRI